MNPLTILWSRNPLAKMCPEKAKIHVNKRKLLARAKPPHYYLPKQPRGFFRSFLAPKTLTRAPLTYDDKATYKK